MFHCASNEHEAPLDICEECAVRKYARNHKETGGEDALGEIHHNGRSEAESLIKYKGCKNALRKVICGIIGESTSKIEISYVDINNNGCKVHIVHFIPCLDQNIVNDRVKRMYSTKEEQLAKEIRRVYHLKWDVDVTLQLEHKKRDEEDSLVKEMILIAINGTDHITNDGKNGLPNHHPNMADRVPTHSQDDLKIEARPLSNSRDDIHNGIIEEIEEEKSIPNNHKRPKGSFHRKSRSFEFEMSSENQLQERFRWISSDSVMFTDSNRSITTTDNNRNKSLNILGVVSTRSAGLYHWKIQVHYYHDDKDGALIIGIIDSRFASHYMECNQNDGNKSYFTQFIYGYGINMAGNLMNYGKYHGKHCFPVHHNDVVDIWLNTKKSMVWFGLNGLKYQDLGTAQKVHPTNYQCCIAMFGQNNHVELKSCSARYYE